MYVFVSISTLVISYFCNVEGQSTCTTPSGGEGNCISLYDCNAILDIVNKADKTPEDTDTLRHSSCGYDGTIPKVCCPTLPRKFSCFTPDGKQGECISLSSCKHLGEMLKPPVSKETITFVQNSRCVGSDHYSVCCSLSPDLTPNPLGLGASNSNPCSTKRGIPFPGSGCCGKHSSLDDRIIGGKATAIGHYPWLVLIEYSENNEIVLLCGGSLISDRYVLTAGHCIAGDVLGRGTPRNVRLGEYDTSNDVKQKDCVTSRKGNTDCTAGAIVIPIEKIIPHPDYDAFDRRNKRNDIALLRMTRSAPYTDFIRPICLPSSDASWPLGWRLIVAGWGNVNYTHVSNVKMHVDLPFITSHRCQQAYSASRSRFTMGLGQMCAGGEAGKDSCKGDSGGPLMNPSEKKYFELVGVVSFGPYPCAEDNVPGVYTKVYEYNSWIRENVRP